MKFKVRCKICRGTADVDTDAKTFDISYPEETTPYGGDYPHSSMRECPLTSCTNPETLPQDERVEEIP